MAWRHALIYFSGAHSFSIIRRGGGDGEALRGAVRRMTYLPHVDGLRAIAIASVVVFHGWPSLLPGGYTGVDVFFVISGFLITRLIAGDIEAGHFSLLAFLARRGRRLVPAQIALFVAVFMIAYRLLWPEPFEDFANSLVASALMFANIYFTTRTGYFDAPLEHRPLLHFWSLGVEDQFYLVWPLLLLVLLPRLGRARVIWPVLVIAAVSLIASELMMAKHRGFVFFNLPTRAFELLIGAMLALILERVRFSRPAAEVLAAGGLAGVISGFLLLAPQSHVPGFAVLPACLGTAALIAAGARYPTAVTRMLSLGPVVFIGLISYSLYLWHWPLMVFQRVYLEREPSHLEMTGVVLLAVVVATASWRFVERPFRSGRAGPRWEPGQAMAGALGVLAVVALAGVAVRIGDGFPWRYPAPVQAMFEQKSLGNPLRRRCDGHQLAFKNDDICNFGRKKQPGESYDVLVIGDSNGDHFVPLVAKYAEEKGLAGRQVTQSTCAPLLGLDRRGRTVAGNEECRTYQRTILQFVEANPRLKLVVVAAAWRSYSGVLEPNGVLHQVGTGEERARLERQGGNLETALEFVVRHFAKRGVAVHLVGQIPTGKSLPVKCAVEALSAGRPTTGCAIPLAEGRDGGRAADETIARLAASSPGVTATLPTTFLCGETSCTTFLGNVFLYRDWGHLNAKASVAMLPYFRFPPVQ